MFSPRRDKVPLELLNDAPEWGRTVGETLNRNTEELARGVEVAQRAAVQTETVTVSVPLPPARPLILTKAAGAFAVWVGRIQSQAGASVLAPPIRWSPTRYGPRIDEVSITAGVYVVVFCWVAP